MPSSYVQQQNVDILKHFAQFLGLIGNDKDKRDALVDVYAQELGDPVWGAYTLEQVKNDIQQEPMRLFMLVSALLADPPQELGLDDQRKITHGLHVILLHNVEYLTVTNDGVWIRELVLDAPQGLVPQQTLRFNRYEYRLNSGISVDEIVPVSVFNYLKSAVVCYHAKLFPTALALAAIAFEACLREVLRGLGRDIITLLPPYKPATVQVDAHLDGGQPKLSFKVKGACQDIRQYFMQNPPTGMGGFLGNVKFDIIRDKLPSGGSGTGSSRKVSLRIKADHRYVDLLSSSQQETTPRQQRADKFADFNKAAEQAGRLQAKQLSPNSAEVLRQVRNYLVHWDETSLQEVLSNGQTVLQYISNQNTVRSTLVNVADFVSSEYYHLRQFELKRVLGTEP